MGKEIERKFLVKDDWEDYPGLAYKHTIVQGYLASADVDSLPSSIRVRMITDLTPPNEDNKQNVTLL